MSDSKSTIGLSVCNLVHDSLLVMNESGSGEPKRDMNDALAEVISNYSLTEILQAISDSAACAGDFVHDCAEDDDPGREYPNVLHLRLKIFQKRLNEAIAALA